MVSFRQVTWLWAGGGTAPQKAGAWPPHVQVLHIKLELTATIADLCLGRSGLSLLAAVEGVSDCLSMAWPMFSQPAGLPKGVNLGAEAVVALGDSNSKIFGTALECQGLHGPFGQSLPATVSL